MLRIARAGERFLPERSRSRFYSYPPPPRKKREPPPAFFVASTIDQIDSCPNARSARLRTTHSLFNLWLWSFVRTDSSTRSCGWIIDGLLHKIDLWICAYQRACYSNRLWSPVSAVHPTTVELLHLLMDSVCSGNFGWAGTKVIYVRAPEKMSIASTETRHPSSFQDEIVQEVLLMILEPIFETGLSARAFGCRPGRGPRECLRFVHGNFRGVSWSVKGDLTALFDSDSQALFGGVLTRLTGSDLIDRLVNAGLNTPAPPVRPPFRRKRPKQIKYLEFESRRSPYWLEVILGFAPEEASTSPRWGCCDKLGPLLLNVLLHKLDSWMEKQSQMFYRPHDPSLGLDFSLEEVGCLNQKPDSSRRLEYVRYGVHFLISVRGMESDLETVMEKCNIFCRSTFLCQPKFSNPREIIRSTRFLGHNFFYESKLKTKWEPAATSSGGKVSKCEKTVFCVEADKKQCVDSLRGVGVLDEEDNTLPCMRLFHEEQLHNNSHINKILRALSDWYKYSTNRGEICEFFGYMFRSSLAKMYAAKYKLHSQVRVARAAGLNLSRPIGSVSGYKQAKAKDAGIEMQIEPLEFVENVPDAVHAPIALDWRPVHERHLKSLSRLLGSVNRRLIQDKLEKLLTE